MTSVLLSESERLGGYLQISVQISLACTKKSLAACIRHLQKRLWQLPPGNKLPLPAIIGDWQATIDLVTFKLHDKVYRVAMDLL